MKKILKRTGIVLLILCLMVTVFYVIAWSSFSRKANRVYHFEIADGIRTDDSLLQRGQHLVAIKGCNQCHGADLSGKVMEDDPMVGRIVAPNLTRGKGGLNDDFSIQDWMMVLQHGVSKEGRALQFMPSNETATMTIEDMSAVISYCKSVVPVDNILPRTKAGPIVTVLTLFDKIPVFSVGLIDHNLQPVSSPEQYSGVALGKYLSVSCTGCHRPDLNGGEPFVPGGPAVPAITRSGNIGKWSAAEFKIALRTGKTPSGVQLDSLNMPWNMTAVYSDEELQGLYEYLQSIR